MRGPVGDCIELPSGLKQGAFAHNAACGATRGRHRHAAEVHYAAIVATLAACLETLTNLVGCPAGLGRTEGLLRARQRGRQATAPRLPPTAGDWPSRPACSSASGLQGRARKAQSRHMACWVSRAAWTVVESVWTCRQTPVTLDQGPYQYASTVSWKEAGCSPLPNRVGFPGEERPAKTRTMTGTAQPLPQPHVWLPRFARPASTYRSPGLVPADNF